MIVYSSLSVPPLASEAMSLSLRIMAALLMNGKLHAPSVSFVPLNVLHFTGSILLDTLDYFGDQHYQSVRITVYKIGLI